MAASRATSAVGELLVNIMSYFTAVTWLDKTELAARCVKFMQLLYCVYTRLI